MSTQDIIQFLNLLNPENPEHETIYILEKMASKNINLHKNLVNIILDHHKITTLDIDTKCGLILTDIFNNLSDLTIHFPDNKTIKCLKSLLVAKIPYFHIMFSDIDQYETNIQLNADYDLIQQIVQLLYFNNSDYITIESYIDLFELMDKYLMKHYFMFMIKYAEENMITIIDYYLDKTNFNDIKRLITIFQNIMMEPYNKKSGFGRRFHKTLTTQTHEILKLLCTSLGAMDINILLFDNWRDLFSYDHQLDAIIKLKDYNLLNITRIPVLTILKFMSHVDFKTNIYYETLNELVLENGNVFFEYEDYIHNTCYKKEIILITKYYPEYIYYKFVKFQMNLVNKSQMSITIQLADKLYPDITIGSRLFFGEVITPTHLKNSYVVTDIVKHCENINYHVDKAQFVSPSIDNITFEIFVDKFIYDHVSEYSISWLVTNVSHVVSDL